MQSRLSSISHWRCDLANRVTPLNPSDGHELPCPLVSMTNAWKIVYSQLPSVIWTWPTMRTSPQQIVFFTVVIFINLSQNDSCQEENETQIAELLATKPLLLVMGHIDPAFWEVNVWYTGLWAVVRNAFPVLADVSNFSHGEEGGVLYPTVLYSGGQTSGDVTM